MEVKGPIGRFLRWLFLVWTTRIRFGIKYDGKFHVELDSPLDTPESAKSGISARLAQLDEARKNMLIALSAVDELKTEAEINQREVRSAIELIQQLVDQKATVEQQLDAVRHIAESDIEVFKQLAGVPSRKQKSFERFVGFLLGLVASIIATLMVWIMGKLWIYMKG